MTQPYWPEPAVLRDVRTAALEPLEGTSVKSAIRKRSRPGPVFCSELGLEGDEHDLTFHGGLDKALHGYSPAHYARWREIYPGQPPDKAFEPGSFGENLVCGSFTDANVCIGDRIAIGWTDASDEVAVLCEVSIPRQPCFKLNSRFGIKGFAKQTYERRMTGWYLRVLRPGIVQEGMTVKLIARKHPHLSITSLMHLIYDSDDEAAIQAAAKTPEMGDEAKRYLANRLAALTRARERKTPRRTLEYRVERRWQETPRVLGVELVCQQDVAAEAVQIGAHVALLLPNGMQRSYSVVSGTDARFVLGIALEGNGRGGSKWLHDNLQPGSTIRVLEPRGAFPFGNGASHRVLVAGGIGITAFTLLIDRLAKGNHGYELHYAVRAEEEVAFKQYLPGNRIADRPGAQLTGRLELYVSGRRRLDIREVMLNRPFNASVLVSGPASMLTEAKLVGDELGLSSDELHLESFSTAETTGAPFTALVGADVGIAKAAHTATHTGTVQRLQVAEAATLLETLLEAGFDVDSSCNAGNCGTCRVRVTKGEVEHRGTGLTAGEQEAGLMLACCSRGKGEIEVEVI